MTKLLERHLEGPGGIRQMVAIALPMVVSNACETVMTFTDRLFLSRLGPEFMSAAMAGGLASFSLMTFFLGLTGYTTAMAAQYLGNGRTKYCALTVSRRADRWRPTRFLWRLDRWHCCSLMCWTFRRYNVNRNGCISIFSFTARLSRCCEIA